MSQAVAEVEQQSNPFRHAPIVAAPSSGNEVTVAAASAREIAEVQTSMIMARRFPRQQVEVMDQILQACTRPTLAEGALYEYAKGGTDIRGPSIRLAECIAQYWGHLDFGWRVIEERPGATKVQTYAWDLQTGTRAKIDFDVVHEVQTRSGKKTLHDPREIYEHIANLAARRKRACILAVIPGDVVEAAQQQCEKTLRLKGEITPELIQKMVTQFAEFGVNRAQLEKRIQRRLEVMTPGMMIQLGKIYTSIKDGMSEPVQWFEVGEGAPQASPGDAGAAGSRASGARAVREKLAARKPQARPEEPDLYPHAHPEPEETPQLPNGSAALQDIVRFARAASTPADVERVKQIALQLIEEDEVVNAQLHITAAEKRIA